MADPQPQEQTGGTEDRKTAPETPQPRVQNTKVEVHNPTPDAHKKSGRRVAKELTLQFLIVIVGIIIFDPIKSWWLGPETYKVYLVGWTGNSEIKKMFRTIQDDSALAHLKIDGREIDVEERDDEGDPKKAFAIATELSDLPDTLMVVGHVLTTSTMKALPVYMRAEPQIPVIATRETHPGLLRNVTQPNCEKVYCAFMPMSPTDEDQAKQAIDFAERRGWDSFLIIRYLKKVSGGLRNSEYADNLIQGYKDEIESRNGKLVEVSDVNDLVSLQNSLNRIEQFKPKCVLFIGPVDNAREFLGAVSERFRVSAYQPALLFSDSAVGDGLLTSDKQIFATFPLPGEEFKSIDNVYGDDAFAIVSALVKDVDQNKSVEKRNWFHHLINMHRVRDARAAVIDTMHDDVANNRTIYRSRDRIYQYVENYNLMKIHFHVWQIQNQRITEVDDADRSATVQTQLRKPARSHELLAVMAQLVLDRAF